MTGNTYQATVTLRRNKHDKTTTNIITIIAESAIDALDNIDELTGGESCYQYNIQLKRMKQ